MKIAALHSHLNGHEWLLVHEKKIWQEIVFTIRSIDATKYKTKVSDERTMKGRLLYAPIELNKAFETRLEKAGWRESRTSYWVTDDYRLIRKTMFLPAPEQRGLIEKAGKRAIFSYNQTDFVKNRVAVEVQMGKYAFIAYDLFVKHLAFFVGDAIDVGVEILPMKAMQEEMSSGPGYYEGALYDIARQGRGVPPVPLVLIGIEP
ncbi:MAG: restriction endonuclease [Candidatus Rokubacteria bacterium]|nr:restriction endonuclease [Candidatus Rokubacteria bacterium]